MRPEEEIQSAYDWFDGHRDEDAPDRLPIILDRRNRITVMQTLLWVLNERRIGDSKEKQA